MGGEGEGPRAAMTVTEGSTGALVERTVASRHSHTATTGRCPRWARLRMLGTAAGSCEGSRPPEVWAEKQVSRARYVC